MKTMNDHIYIHNDTIWYIYPHIPTQDHTWWNKQTIMIIYDYVLHVCNILRPTSTQLKHASCIFFQPLTALVQMPCRPRSLVYRPCPDFPEALQDTPKWTPPGHLAQWTPPGHPFHGISLLIAQGSIPGLETCICKIRDMSRFSFSRVCMRSLALSNRDSRACLSSMLANRSFVSFSLCIKSSYPWIFSYSSQLKRYLLVFLRLSYLSQGCRPENYDALDIFLNLLKSFEYHGNRMEINGIKWNIVCISLPPETFHTPKIPKVSSPSILHPHASPMAGHGWTIA